MSSLNVVKEKNIIEFLNIRNTELLNYYRQAPKEMQKVLKNVYNACCRFNLLDIQTMYMLEEVIRPYKQNILMDLFKEGDDIKCHGKVKHKENGETVQLGLEL